MLQRACTSDCLPGSVALPVAQQSPGSWEREQIRHRHQNLGDVDRGLTNTLDAYAGRIAIRTSIAVSLTTMSMWPPVTINPS